MRLFTKIFICVAVVLSAAVLLSGYLLITRAYENAVEREAERALSQYAFERAAVQDAIVSGSENWRDWLSWWDLQAGGLKRNAPLLNIISGINGKAVFLTGDRYLLYSDFAEDTAYPILGDIKETETVYGIQKIDDADYLIAGSKLIVADVSVYMLIATDISHIAIQRDVMTGSFRNVYVVTIAVSFVVILFLSAFITRPVKNLTKAANNMARGNPRGRLPVSGRDEIAELSGSFNAMADAVEEKMKELELNAKQKEDFVASFAHELKTPLTSVIGYADILYQKELTPAQTKNAAMYILSEGLRLEALSLKLMELIVLEKQDFVLEEVPAEALLENVVRGLQPMFEEKNIRAHTDVCPAALRVEFDLFKTLLINLIDNASKAGCTDIWIAGKCDEPGYTISITDNGRGIPEAELGRITEAFYMVDKSRSRREHGAGIGLALAAKIAEIHGSRLVFKSEVGVGTSVGITLREMDLYHGGKKLQL